MFERVAKVTLASLLLALLLVLGGLSVSGLGTSLGVSTQTRPASQTPNAQAERANDQATEPARTENALQTTPQVQGAVLDARTAARKAGPTVVTVVNYLDNSGQGGTLNGTPQASGSGVIIDSRGYIVTNYHVVANQQSLEVIFSDGKVASAKLVGYDAYSDLAVLKVEGTMPAVATWGDSDKLEPGQPVVAIGSPLGDFQNTVTAGVVSQLHREIKDAASTSLRDLIQTDAAINHGNSGGPLLDLEGNIVGINVAVVRDGGGGTGLGQSASVAEGLGFAIPANTAREVANQLISNGAVSRPFIGITYQTLNERMATAQNLTRKSGVLITETEVGGPAEQAGLKPGDIIAKIDGVELNEDSTLIEVMMKYKPGDTITLTVLPAGATAEKEVQITLATRPKDR